MAIGIQQKDEFDKFLDSLKEPREVMAAPTPEPEPEDFDDGPEEINIEDEIDPVLEKKKL